jgi:putative transposase
MDNHVHMIAVPQEEDSLSIMCRRVHGRYAQYVNTKYQRSGHLWQNRFFSCALSETHLWKAIRYVEFNPVRAGMEKRPEQHRWSSAEAHVTGEDSPDVLDMQFWTNHGGRDFWLGIYGTEQDSTELRLLRRCTYSGRPFGDEEFLREQEEMFDRNWRRWSFEKNLTVATAST